VNDGCMLGSRIVEGLIEASTLILKFIVKPVVCKSRVVPQEKA
jgi:hypothetical protein